MDDILIKVLRDHLNEVKTEPFDTDWDSLVSTAMTHEIGGIVFYQCKDFIPEEYKQKLESAYSVALFYYVNRIKAMDVISKTFSGLNSCSVKGLEVAKFYPVPALRTMGDCDIVVVPKDCDEAISRLRTLGAEGKEYTENHEWIFDYKGLHFELHDTLEKSKYTYAGQNDFFNGFEQYIKDGKLDWNFHFLFLITHLRKHFMGYGVGLRQFMDLAVVIKNGPKLDWEWIETKLEDIGMRDFAHACYSLNDAWFGIKPPVEFNNLSSSTINAVTENILGNGVFGFDDQDNNNNAVKNAFLMKRGNRLINRIAYLCGKTFPDYSYMKGYPGCGFIVGRKWLLPLAWIRRFIHIAFSKDNKSRVDSVKNMFIPDEELDKRKELMNQMGLM